MAIKRLPKILAHRLLPEIAKHYMRRYTKSGGFYGWPTEKHLRSFHIDTRCPVVRRLNNQGLLDTIDPSIVESAHSYNQTLTGQIICPSLSIAFWKTHRIDEPRALPRTFYWNQLLPHFNENGYLRAYTDKNIYSILLSEANQPRTILKSVNRNYFGENDTPTDKRYALKNKYGKVIIKPSRADNGEDIISGEIVDGKIATKTSRLSLDEIEDRHGGNFVMQELLEQHEKMKAPHPWSLNTLRVLTIRWKQEIHYLLAFVRFGTNHSITDNAGTGGICVGVQNDGTLMSMGVTEDVQCFHEHPTTGYRFKNFGEIPGIKDAISMCIKSHTKILHHGLVSWDVAIGVDAEPVLIECNFRGAFWLYQLATGRPVLGNLHEPIMKEVCEKQKD